MGLALLRLHRAAMPRRARPRLPEELVVELRSALCDAERKLSERDARIAALEALLATATEPAPMERRSRR